MSLYSDIIGRKGKNVTHIHYHNMHPMRITILIYQSPLVT